jgi:hypothetical protein
MIDHAEDSVALREAADVRRIATVSGALEVAAVTGGTARSAAAMAAVGFVLVACFQVALALGAPWGKAAWGGAHERLPNGLRIASSFAVILWLAAALVVLTRAGYDWSPLPFSVARWGTWVLVGILLLGTLVNLASRSRLERLTQTPIAAILSILCLLVALD